ncbi:MAG: hypothetical protein M1321_02755 [Candidatus Marsarchaeota archaeon]|jgi:large subunit ribosomal protein L21e|nr:hypothetical protein [Candidatus Marsarchaeota archaeon]
MTQRSHGLFSGRTRNLARHNAPSSLGISRRIKRFEKGDRVVVIPKGNFRNIPHPRYRGRIATVVEKRGDSYVVEMMVSKSMKRTLVVPQMHLNKL